ncbi:hypothetical protein ACE01N_17255 [Saccharicrinis sp. FJH2]|uniref:hypothetical protein n=1 Tax=Saccharicrinis sp. FJH65 TaxID=3344659 RepID=UPI0035F39633
MVFILSAIAVFVILILIGVLFRSKKDETEEEPTLLPDADCCGAHEVCEAESLMNHTNKPVYFEDEELDRFAGKDVHDYSNGDITEFEDILYTLKEKDVSGWLKSLQLRNIELPIPVRDEALMIISERRFG